MDRDPHAAYRKMIAEKLDAAVIAATPLAEAGDYAAAEAMIRQVESDIPGMMAITKMYIAIIASLGGASASTADRPRVLHMFKRAVYLRETAYPTPHTQEESDNYDAWSREDRAKVVAEIGFDPAAWGDGQRTESGEAEIGGAEPEAPVNFPNEQGPIPNQPVAVSNPPIKRKNTMLTTSLAIVAMLIGVVASVCMIVLFLASGANASETAIRQIKMLIASVVLVLFLSMGGSIGLLIIERGWLACGAGLFPAVYAIVVTIVLVKMEW